MGNGNTPIKFTLGPREFLLYRGGDIGSFPGYLVFGWFDNYKHYSFDFQGQYNEYYLTNGIENMVAPALMRLLPALLINNDAKEILIKDFNDINYPIDSVDIEQFKHPLFKEKTVELSVKEKDLRCPVAYYTMSQGMFRALSLIVIIEDLLLRNNECTLVIDDIGEGLDFERSSKLIKLIFSKLKDSNIQFIATTNNRFLINAVDIRDLNILERDGHVVKSYNYSNSKEQFDEFEFTGLGSFDLFRYQMYKTQEAQVE
ncbi:hypothetical protein MBAV_003355 [Candidatus Magnetobacterium bavaricum]|uniref:Uncharacterized protein n=1 Tax=Candidatus Magnetobacterium bavaricum TaxID=29290 RepID=A0A0F3GR67_9BACT|nr:hypothetical protein MBAV_003355 [Candidatus Magnetobacterium bavaricum]